MSRPVGARPLMKTVRRAGAGAAGGDMQHDVDIDMSPPDDNPASPVRVPRAPAAAAAATGAGGSAGRKTTTTLRPSPSKTQPLPSSKLLPSIAGGASDDAAAGTLLSLPPSRLGTGSLRPTDPVFSGPGNRVSQTFFTLTPSSLDFTAVQPGQIYFQTLSIQNQSARRRSVRFLAPKTDHFSMELSTVATEVAPGLTLKIKMYFKTPNPPTQSATQNDEQYALVLRQFETQSWHDVLSVMSDSGEGSPMDRTDVQLNAWTKRSAIVFNSFVDFGSVAPSAGAAGAAASKGSAGASSFGGNPGTVSQILTLRNDGNCPGRFRIEFDRGVPVTVTPATGVLAPLGQGGNEVQCKVELNTSEVPLGSFRALGRVWLEDQSTTPMLLDLHANVLEASLQLIWPTLGSPSGPGGAKKGSTLSSTATLSDLSGRQLERVAEVYFGSLFFGETRKIDAVLFNNSPGPINFLVALNDARDEKGGNAALAIEAARQEGAAAAGAGRSGRLGAPLRPLLSASAPSDARSIPGSVLGDHDLDAASATADDTPAYLRPDMLVSPMEGRLEAYGSQRLTFVFQPRQPLALQKEMQRGFKNNAAPGALVGGGGNEDSESAMSQTALVGPDGSAVLHEKPEPPFVKYAALAKIDSLDGRFRTVVPVLGNANLPAVALSTDAIQFGSCPVHDHRDAFVTLKNVSSELSLGFEFAPLAHFTVRPSFGRLAPRQSQRVVVSFVPNNLGRFTRRRLDLRLLGDPSGKQPSSLVPKTNQSKASIKAAEVARAQADAIVTVPLLLSGISETIGLNRTIELTTGGPARQAADFAPVLSLVKSAAQVAEEKEMALMEQADVDVEEDPLDGELTLVTPGAAAASAQQRQQAGSKQPFRRITGWNNPALANQYQGRYEVSKGSLDNRVTFTPAELHARTTNQKFYQQFLAGASKARADGKAGRFQPEAVDAPDTTLGPEEDRPRDAAGMGLRFASGLVEPQVALPPQATQLKLKYPQAGFEGEGRKRTVVSKHSAAAANAKPLKSQPTTQAEKRDCEACLSPEEIQSILRGPGMIEFGRLCVGARATREYRITNDLETHIQVSLKIRALELVESFPQSAMIPPGVSAVFTIVFQSSQEQEFSRQVVYTINGQHDFSFGTSAFVVPMDLTLSRSELAFDFNKADQAAAGTAASSTSSSAAASASFSVVESLVLENPYSVPTEFFWTLPSTSDAFSVAPSKGVVAAYSKLVCAVKFEPKWATPAAGVSADLVCNVTGGAAKKVAVRAALAESSCSFARGIKTVDFGAMCVGTPVTKSVVLRNDGGSRTVFKIEDVPTGVRVKPMSAKLEAGTSATIQISVYPTPSTQMKGSALTVAVRGRPKDSKPLKLALRGEAFMPSISIAEPAFEFGGVTLGSSLTRTVSVSNTGAVPASLYVDLSRALDFSLGYAEALGQEEIREDGSVRNAIIQRVSSATIKRNGSTASIDDATSSTTSLSAAAGAKSGSAYIDALDESAGGYSIFLAPRSSLEFQIVFTPTRVIEHDFELPLSVAGIPSFASLRRVVTAHGLKPKISLSVATLDFGKRVLLKRGRATKNPYISKFSLRNEDAAPIRWHFKSESSVTGGEPATPGSGFASPVPSSRGGLVSRVGAFSPGSTDGDASAGSGSDVNWRMEPTHGTLQPGQEAVVLVYFSPTAAQNYANTVDIYLDSPTAGNNGLSSPVQPSRAGAVTSLDMPSASPKPYTSLLLTGCGTTPRLLFSVDQVVLPIVPLGVASRFTFLVHNEGYENLELRWETGMDAVRAPITINLPQGSTLGSAHPSLPVEVVFLATKPVSFCLSLNFFDMESNRFSIPVIATADNSVLTIQEYVSKNQGKWDIVLERPLPEAGQAQDAKSGGAYQKVLNLVELSVDSIAARARAAAVAKSKKQMYAHLQSAAPVADGTSSPSAFDFAGAEDETAASQNGDGINTPGSGPRGLRDADSRLTPVKMLASQSAASSGDSLFTHTLESVLAYLHSSNLLTGPSVDGEEDIPVDSPPSGQVNEGDDVNSPSKASTGVLSAASGHKRRGSSSPSRHASFALSADTFPQELIKSGGSLVRGLIRALSGKAVPTTASKKKNAFGSRGKNETTISLQSTLGATSAAGMASTLAATQTREYLPPNAASFSATAKSDALLMVILQDYEELLIFLKSQGALLGGVKPWHLLGLNQLQRLLASNGSVAIDAELGVSATMSPAELTARTRRLEKDFPSLSRLGWLTVLVQVIKVFIVARVTPAAFRALPGMSPDLACMSWKFEGSNVYSVGESILLEWLSFHYNRSAPLAPRSVVDYQKLTDGIVLCGVISSHVSSVTAIQHLRTNIISIDDCLYNMTKLCAGLKELGLSWFGSAASLVASNARDMVLFVLWLYQHLPHFIPKSTLEFKTALGAPESTQCIELSNPSSGKSIAYSVSMEGSSDFKVDRGVIRLAPRGKPGSTVKVPVRFQARFSKPVEARLVFTAATPEESSGGKGAAQASTLVFVLKSHIVDRLPSSSYTSESRMYEPTTIDVRVTNPFAVDCTFNVTCKIEQEPSAHHHGHKGREASPTRGGAGSEIDNGKGSARGSGAGVSRMLSARSSASVRSGAAAQERQPPAVFCPFERVKLRAGETHSMGVQFLPLHMGSYRARLVFLDDQAGEFMIELNCVATPPAPLELFKWTTTVRGGSETKPLQLSFKNPGLDSARAQHFERIRNLSRQQRDLKKNKSDWNHQILRSDILPAGGSVSYNAHSTSPFFSIASHVVLNDIKLEKDSLAKGGRTGGPAAGAGSVGSSRKGTAAGGPGIITDLTNAAFGGSHVAASSSAAPASKATATAAYLSGRAAGPDNKFSLVFTPRGAGVYRGAIVLHSALDSRVYSLEVTVLAEDSNPLLEFKAPARQSVTQEIPLSITTGGAELQTFRASLMAGKMFTGPAEVTVYPGTPASYPLTFTPTWVSEVTGTLTLVNPRTDDRFVYDLRGVGEEPLAEKHLVLEASARSKATHRVAVSNPSNTDLYFTVECDLPSFAGPSTFKVRSGSTMDYAFTLCPASSGTLLGSLTFLQPNKSFQWYGLEVRVAPPEPEEQVAISCVARGAKQCRIEIPNPSAQPQSCEVNLEGVGLFGPKSIELAPQSKTVYEFLYSPLQPVAQSEGVLSVSDVNGGAEMWWRLLLSAPAPEAESVDFGEVEVGTTAALEIELENPTDESLAMRSVVSGPGARNFSVQPTKIVLAPLSRSVVNLKYTPSTLDGAAQTATVVFSHPALADFVFQASGLGSAPSVMPATALSTPLDSKVSSAVPFRNPFSKSIKVDIELSGDGEQPAPFQLLLKRTTSLVLPAYTVLQIPFTFAPKSIRAHRAEITVRLASESSEAAAAGQGQGLAWRFPLEGEAEGQTSEQPLVLQCKARERLQEIKELRLGGLTQFQSMGGEAGAGERFSVEIEAATDAGQIALSKSLDLALLPAESGSSAASSASNSNAALSQRVRLDFFPQVPFRCAGFLVLSRSGGGRWKFPLLVEVGPPDADDTIRLESAVHATASVGFWIRNYKDTPTPFKAALSFDSSPQFSVSPASGIMPPMGEVDAQGHSGTRFVVSFSPVEYGSTLSGSLHISAGDVFHRYDLVGTHARWTAPVVSSTLDNNNAEYAAERAAQLAASSRKNFLQHNMTAGLASTEVLAHKVSSVRAWKGIGNTSSAAIAAASSQGFGAGAAARR